MHRPGSPQHVPSVWVILGGWRESQSHVSLVFRTGQAHTHTVPSRGRQGTLGRRVPETSAITEGLGAVRGRAPPWLHSVFSLKRVYRFCSKFPLRPDRIPGMPKAPVACIFCDLIQLEAQLGLGSVFLFFFCFL